MDWLQFWAMLNSIEHIAGTVIAVAILAVLLWAVWKDVNSR